MTEITDFDGLPLDSRQAHALAEWRRLAGGEDGTPRQHDFRPERVAHSLPSAMLLHVEREGEAVRLRQRLEGRFVVLAFGEGSGGLLDDIYSNAHLGDMMPRYLESALTGDAAMTECTAPRRDGTPFDFTRLILPFADRDGAVNRLLVVFHFDPVTLARLPGPLKVRREAEHDSVISPAPVVIDMLRARQAG